MGTLVIRLMLIGMALIHFESVLSQSLHSKPVFQIFVDERGRKIDLTGLLNKEVPQAETGDCKSAWDIFYFRVNSKGKIDSLHHEGGLPTEVTAKIIFNIYSTETHWRIAEKSKTCWYIFPYFDYGGTFYENSNCPSSDKIKQKLLLDIAANMTTISHLVKGEEAVLLTASQNGGPIINK